MANICISCGDEYSPRRAALGYRVCLECGGAAATKERRRRARCTAPAYNKGAYMYVSTKRAALDVGR